MSVSMNPQKMELSPEQTSAVQALALSNMVEGMGQNIARAQGLQQGACSKEGLTFTRVS